MFFLKRNKKKFLCLSYYFKNLEKSLLSMTALVLSLQNPFLHNKSTHILANDASQTSQVQCLDYFPGHVVNCGQETICIQPTAFCQCGLFDPQVLVNSLNQCWVEQCLEFGLFGSFEFRFWVANLNKRQIFVCLSIQQGSNSVYEYV